MVKINGVEVTKEDFRKYFLSFKTQKNCKKGKQKGKVKNNAKV